MDEKLEDKNRGSRLSIIGPLAGLAAAIITAFADLRPALQYTMVFLLVVIAVASIYVVFGSHAVSVWRKMRIAIKHHLLVKNYFAQFSMFVDRLIELSQDNRCDTLPYAFANMKSMPPEFIRSRSLMCDLANFLTLFKAWMKKSRKGDFELLIEWFESILRIYNNQLVLEPFRQVRNMDQNKLTKYEKENYEKNREHYVRFLQDYENFARAINTSAGKTIARPCFDKPGTLSNGNGYAVEGAPSQSSNQTGKTK
jgi:hypothetical protein